MADVKIGKVVHWQTLSPILATFQLLPASGDRFPDYQAGQYIALRRDDCRLTKKIVGEDGQPRYDTMLDESGRPKRGPVTHSYSIASAPFETQARGHLEFYVVLERDEKGELGRLTESMFRMNEADHQLTYVNRIVGDFTLAKRALGFRNVLLVGTGTGLAPFVSMIKQLHFDASKNGSADSVRYTLLHANRTREELAYHQDLVDIEASRSFDFVYIASVSRPTQQDVEDPSLGRGRANNVLRYALEMPLKERQDLDEAVARGEDPSRLAAALNKVTAPALPGHVARADLQDRLEPSSTVILTCGNTSLMEDIEHVAKARGIGFEMEEW
jgi:ferredoxin-NADP reductase